MYRFLFTLVLLTFLCGSPQAQQKPAYPYGYFRNPMGIPMQLSANFGELRPNHWHMGLDIRTQAKENLPVYAAASGYIAHIGIRPQSFGRFIIINHPNGLSTLYGHLNDFFPELEKWVEAQQYKRESWAVELEPDPALFPVEKGQFIAYSGNTGGSQGPHLHFEIIDTKTDKRLNPLLFGFPVEDAVPPVLQRLAMYDRRHSVYNQSPRFYALKKTDSGYIIPKLPVIRTGLDKVSFALQMYDQQSGSVNPNGVYAATLFVDEEPHLSFVIDSVDYAETAYMNAHIDYRLRFNGGGWVQHLSRLPGEAGVVYKSISGRNGLIAFSDTAVHAIRMEVYDTYGNKSELRFGLQYNDSLAALHKSLPPVPHFAPNIPEIFSKPDFRLELSPRSLYDSVRINYIKGPDPVSGSALSAAHQLNDADVPVHAPFTVWIKPSRSLPAVPEEKFLILRTWRGSRSLRKASLENGWLKASFDDFGSFQAFIDTVPPVLEAPGKGDTINLSPASRILFTPTDNFGVIKNFRAELNGQWLRFTNDKSRTWIYRFDERCPFGVHELKVMAEDLAGNRVEKTWWFKREPYTPPPPKKKPVYKKKKPVKKPITKKTTQKKK